MAVIKEKNPERRAFIRMSIFGVLTVACIGLAVFGLIQNSQGAKDRYDKLIAVDQSGGDVEAALNDLRVYIFSHMNTQIGSETGIKPPIQLQGTFERLQEERQAQASQSNQELYAAAQADCERRNPTGFSGSSRIACIEAYVDANGQGEVTIAPIEDDLYKFDFAPPFWSADLAGFSILFAVIFGFVFFVDLILYFRVRHNVHISN